GVCEAACPEGSEIPESHFGDDGTVTLNHVKARTPITAVAFRPYRVQSRKKRKKERGRDCWLFRTNGDKKKEKKRKRKQDNVKVLGREGEKRPELGKDAALDRLVALRRCKVEIGDSVKDGDDAPVQVPRPGSGYKQRTGDAPLGRGQRKIVSGNGAGWRLGGGLESGSGGRNFNRRAELMVVIFNVYLFISKRCRRFSAGNSQSVRTAAWTGAVAELRLELPRVWGGPPACAHEPSCEQVASSCLVVPEMTIFRGGPLKWLAGAVARCTEAGGTFRRAASLFADAGRSCRVSLDMAKGHRVSVLRICCGTDGLRGRLFHVDARQIVQRCSLWLFLTGILAQRRDCARRIQAP
ncbi:hypothetical protein CCMA1212_002502, partial [Trichoderma ghanense]